MCRDRRVGRPWNSKDRELNRRGASDIRPHPCSRSPIALSGLTRAMKVSCPLDRYLTSLPGLGTHASGVPGGYGASLGPAAGH